MEKVICPHCGKEFSKYGIKNHIDIIHLKLRPAPTQGKESKLKNRSYDDIYGERALEKRKKMSKSISKAMTGKTLSSETKKKISDHRK